LHTADVIQLESAPKEPNELQTFYRHPVGHSDRESLNALYPRIFICCFLPSFAVFVSAVAWLSDSGSTADPRWKAQSHGAGAPNSGRQARSLWTLGSRSRRRPARRSARRCGGNSSNPCSDACYEQRSPVGDFFRDRSRNSRRAAVYALGRGLKEEARPRQ